MCTSFLIRAFFIFLTDLSRAERASAGGASAPKARGAERAPAARRRRNTPGGHPAQGASAPERASRPQAEGRAGQGERSARRGRDGGKPEAHHRRAPEPPQPYNNLSFVWPPQSYKTEARFCMTGAAAADDGGRASRPAASAPPRGGRAIRKRPAQGRPLCGCSEGGDFVTQSGYALRLFMRYRA